MPTMLEAMRAIRASDLPPVARHLMMTIVSLSDPSTCVIPDRHMPSLTDLTKFTGMSRSTVAVQLNFLERHMWLKRDKPSVHDSLGAKARTRYFVLVQTSPVDGLVQESDQSDTRTSPGDGPGLVRETDQTSPGDGPEVPSHTSHTSQETSAAQSAPDDALFDVDAKPPAPKPAGTGKRKLTAADETPEFREFYAAYPRRVDRGDARQAWQKAVAMEAPDAIISAAKKYAEHHRTIGTETRFLKHPATWLNKECWHDELTPERNNGRTNGFRPHQNYADPTTAFAGYTNREF